MSNLTWERTGRRPGVVYHLRTNGVLAGFRVVHCGHPTALYPYYVEFDMGEETRTVLNEQTGRAFQLLKEAQLAAEELFDEYYEPCDHNWVEVRNGQGDPSEPYLWESWTEYHCTKCEEVTHYKPEGYLSLAEERAIAEAEYGR